MENFFLLDDFERIDNFKNLNPTKEDYFNIIGESDPEFLIKLNSSLRSVWDGDENYLQPKHYSNNALETDFDEDEYNNRHNIKIPQGFEEIELYDSSKSFDENFETGNHKKYILIEVDKNKSKLKIKDPNDILASPQSECLVDLWKLDEHSLLQFIPIDYDSFWGVRLKTFIKYKSDFFTCDERIMFEIMLYKYKSFDYKPFYWSKEVMFNEVGIKKDRATNIIRKFISLGIITKKLEHTKIDNNPRQANFYNINVEKVLELIPKIYEDRDNIDIENQIRKYLTPALKK